MKLNNRVAGKSSIRLFNGSPVSEDADLIVVDPGVGQLAGLDGLRLLLSALAQDSSEALRNVAEQRQAEWNFLFPGAFDDAASLAGVAATCSERRLHAESEQIFRVIAAVGEAVTAVGADREHTILFRRTGMLDFPTLRAIPHLVERVRMTGSNVRFVLAELDVDERAITGHGSEERLALRRRLLEALVARLGRTPEPGGVVTEPAPAPAPAGAERGFLDRLTTAATAEDAVAAAITLMRSSFFSTNYDTGVLAARRLLAELAAAPTLEVDRARAIVAEMDLGDDPGSIGVDAGAMIDHDSLVSLAHRYLGMVYVFMLDYATALRHLQTAATLGPGIVRARARLLRALLLIKRVGDVTAGFGEVAEGLAGLAGDGSEIAAVESAWLYNVKALGHVQLRELDAALAEERTAVRLIGKLTTTDATHLKINLVSNISVLREYSGRPDAALRVWRQFSRRSTRWGDTFFKHHAYREGGLLVRCGATEAALDVLAEAYRLATAARDDFYRAHMALERGSLLLPSRPDEAGHAFDSARGHARAVGDPFLLALATAGWALALGELDEGRRRESATLAQASLSYPRQRAALLQALTIGSDEQVRACLPKPGTKLNRPFYAVQLTLPELR